MDYDSWAPGHDWLLSKRLVSVFDYLEICQRHLFYTYRGTTKRRMVSITPTNSNGGGNIGECSEKNREHSHIS